MAAKLHETVPLQIPRSELIAAAAVQGLRGSIQITRKKQLIDNFGSAEALCKADKETLKGMLPQRYWKQLPFHFPLEQAEMAITRHEQLQVRTVLGYRPNTVAGYSRAASDTADRDPVSAITAAEDGQQTDTVSSPCTYSAALAHWSGAPLLWYEAGSCRTGGKQGVGILAPESLPVNQEALDISSGNAYRDKAEEILHWIYEQDSYSIHALMHPADNLLLKAAVENGYCPLVILPHGIDAEQLQQLPDTADALLNHITVISPFPAGTALLPYRLHARNTFFSQYCDSIFFMYGAGAPVHTRIFDIAASRNIPVTADIFPQTAGKHSPQQAFLLKLWSGGAVPYTVIQQNNDTCTQRLPEKLPVTDSQTGIPLEDELFSGSVKKKDIPLPAGVSAAYSTNLHKAVAECLGVKPRTTSELAHECSISQQHIQQILVELSLQSLAEYRADGRWYAEPPD